MNSLLKQISLLATGLCLGLVAAPQVTRAQFAFTEPTSASIPQGSAVTIKWTGGAPNKRVNLTLVKITPFKVVAQVANNVPNSGTATWRLPAGDPNVPCGDQYQFYIEDVPRAAWQYGPKFTIACGFAFSQPASGANLKPGAQVPIKWSGGKPGSPVTLSLVMISPNKVAAVVAPNIPNSGSNTWTIPANDPNIPCGTQYQFYIEDIPRTIWQYGPKFTIACAQAQQICPAGQTMCGGNCFDIGTDARNCGACGHVCAAGTTCTSGACAANPVGQQQSSGGAVPPKLSGETLSLPGLAAPSGLASASTQQACGNHWAGAGGLSSLDCAAAVVQGGLLALTWNWNGSGIIDGFRLYQVSNPAPHKIGDTNYGADTLIDGGGQNRSVTGYVVTPPADGYIGKCYAVTAVSGRNESMTSNGLCVKTPLPPASLRRTTDANECAQHGAGYITNEQGCADVIQLQALILVWNWNKNVPVDGFRIYVIDNGKSTEYDSVMNGAANTGELIAPSMHYQGKCYEVTAYVGKAESPRSNRACVR